MSTHRIDLAVMFPPRMGAHGACTTLADMSRDRFAGPHRQPLYTTRNHAARTIIAANLEPHTPGKGSRATRRMFALRRIASVRALMPAASFSQ